MTIEKITTIGDSVVMTLSKSIVEQLGLTEGDEIHVNVIQNRLVAEGKTQIAREKRLNSIAQELIERRSEVYKALAAGVDEPDV